MRSVRAWAVQWLIDDFPGRVAVHLATARGVPAILFDKPSVFGIEKRFDKPFVITIDCDVIEDLGETVIVELHHGLTDGYGNGRFEVLRELLGDGSEVT